jgi:hypothetical protein
MSKWKMFLRSNIYTLAIGPPSSKSHRSPLLQHPFWNGNSRSISSRLRILGCPGEGGQFQLLQRFGNGARGWHATFLYLQGLASTFVGYKGCVQNGGDLHLAKILRQDFRKISVFFPLFFLPRVFHSYKGKRKLVKSQRCLCVCFPLLTSV